MHVQSLICVASAAALFGGMWLTSTVPEMKALGIRGLGAIQDARTFQDVAAIFVGLDPRRAPRGRAQVVIAFKKGFWWDTFLLVPAYCLFVTVCLRAQYSRTSVVGNLGWWPAAFGCASIWIAGICDWIENEFGKRIVSAYPDNAAVEGYLSILARANNTKNILLPMSTFVAGAAIWFKYDQQPWFRTVLGGIMAFCSAASVIALVPAVAAKVPGQCNYACLAVAWISLLVSVLV